MTASEVLEELRTLGSRGYRNVLMNNHGVREPCFGVKIADLQKIRKRVGTDHRLALDLYASGNYDAMYLAGLVADDARMTRKDLRAWVRRAYAGALPGTTVATVAAGGRHGRAMAREWIDSARPLVAAAGWATWSHLVSITPDEELDLAELGRLLERVATTIHGAPDAARYQMNGFVIAVGCFVGPLTSAALRAAARIGPVTADLGANSCRVPSATESIRKVEQRGSIGRKRRSAKC